MKLHDSAREAMRERVMTDSNGRKHITTEPLLRPPQRTWVGLTDEEIEVLAKKHNGIFYDCDIDFARAIEAKLKDKNESKN